MSETLANMERLGGIDYSTDEQWTGRRWIDGKKIYEKTFSTSSPSDKPLIASNVGMAMDKSVRFKRTGIAGWDSGNYFNSINDYYFVRSFLHDNADLKLYVTASGTVEKAIITVIYTKSTDS